ncbi:hypothetical protein GCK72_019001 [Caenorhabditis remanei]|uniref:7TM GPCR serpentine receptor class x (Srx) domain-containing protein n=1 Tax=Caenorhabditis remanei TaxID=31234 RepID=E3LZY4_CAERE|nr:hypothetical protein GCK72_019001 [Caenorhabditis remanei]EFO87839.1 hypothetical protein CRE_05763 [Caenorhabditis remanei]KAF1752446.1 hypothetical protein GCK72_019001 [Caenorhabditis remanei]
MANSTLSDPLNWFTSVLMTVNAVFGIVCNVIIINNVAKSATERTSFNLICAARAIANVIILGLGFLSLFVPLTIYGDTLFPPVHHAIVITIINSLYTGLQNCGVLIAINRFCAMFFSIQYSRYFTPTVTFFAILLLLSYRIFRMGQDIVQNIETQCFSTYSSEFLTWFPTRDPNCRNKYADVVDGTVILLVALVLINIATFVKIYLFYKSTEMDSKEIRNRIRKNRIMFSQTIIQDLNYCIDMLFTFKLSTISSSRIWTFISGSLIWECVHSSDGLIMIMFNEKLTFLKRSFFSASSPSSSVAPQQSPVILVSSPRSPAPIG